jgi:hypothetical protein
MKLVLDDVLDPGPLWAVIGLRPQVGLRARSTPDLQGDEVVLFVGPGGGIHDESGFDLLAIPTPTQHRAFELLEAPIPLTLK